MRVLVLGAKPASLYNFRGCFIKKLSSYGCSVCSIASGASEQEIKKINELGSEYKDIHIGRSGINPFVDFKTYYCLRKRLKKDSYNIILSYTIKPVIWGGLAARSVPDCKFYALITGLGFAFQKGGWKKRLLNKLVAFLYKAALKNSEKVIFQNPDNKNVFIEQGIIPEDKACIVNGSGVDLSHYTLSPLAVEKTRFLLIARLLGDKGIREYIRAANIVKKQYPTAQFQLVGPEDPSPDGISIAELNDLNIDNAVEYKGATADVRPFIEECTVFVLPSYHEGLPRTVLEAMAIGRPILTTDVPGCRETVVDGLNGFLVERGNVEQLASRMIWFVENSEKLSGMAQVSRAMVEEKFDVNKVNEDLSRIMNLDNINNCQRSNERYK
ncbi:MULTISPECIES: glycosyltransferase family 4 protein [Vibrio]|uniref:glycosyltransferase family 4 protein n=2 Tax=Vibrionaceae TaxID=641 RepID=UPI00102DD440|nr:MULTISPECIES: glycosyltransferase family 4 protein [Vibrio]MCF7509168.1 glycosyltransferase family 4 protein [Vibrio sp. D54]RZV23009.1 glycosyltransferase family 1 protein [Vibrio alginolyticus]